MKKKILFIHVMKTGGMSLRLMLEDAVGDKAGFYPRRAQLAQRRRGWYPDVRETVDMHRRGEFKDVDVLCGHYPPLIGELIFGPSHLQICLLRDPLERSLSMIEHFRRTSGSSAAYEEVLENQDLVRRQIRNYQTKVFAFDTLEQCPVVNRAFEVTDAGFENAMERLHRVDVIGLTGRFAESTEAISAATGLSFPRAIYTNKGGEKEHCSSGLRAKLGQQLEYDFKFYEAAVKLFEEQQRRLGLNKPSLA